MLFKNTAIVGLGVIGGSLAGALRKYEVSERISGITRSDAYLRAQEMKLIDKGYPIDELEKAVKDSDLVILAVPIRKICAFMPEILPIVKKGCIITDAGSTKHVVIEVANTYGSEGKYFVGGHPMTGSEKTGFEAANPDLFRNRPYAVVRGDKTPDEVTARIVEMVIKIGAKPIQLDAVTHDRIVAGVSHLPQVLATALMNVIGGENENDDRYFLMSGPAFREMTRIAGSSFSIWDDIFVSNRRNITTVLQNFVEELKRVQKSIDKPSVQKDFVQANAYREFLLTGERER